MTGKLISLSTMSLILCLFPLFALSDPKFGIKFNLKRLLKGVYQNLEETLPVREVFRLNPTLGRVNSEGEETVKEQARRGFR